MTCNKPDSFIRPQLAKVRSFDYLPYVGLGQLGEGWGWSNIFPKWDYRRWQDLFDRDYLDYGDLDDTWPPISYVDGSDDFLGIGTVEAGTSIRGLVGYWPGSLDGSNDLIDTAGGDLTMADNNGPIATSTTPSGAPCVDLDGVDQYYSRADEAAIDVTSSFTFGLWCKLDTWTKNAPFFGKWGVSGQRSWTFYQEIAGIPPTNVAVFHVVSDGTNVSGIAQTAGTYILNNDWNHLVGRLIVGGSMSIFVNGRNYTDYSYIPSEGPFDGNGILGVGWNTGAGDYSDGKFADIWLSSVPLLDDEIAQIYSSQAGLYGH